MKIGIITLSASDNCGSLLQAYALKKVLEKYGEVEIINFSSQESHLVYDVPKYRGIKQLLNKNKMQQLYKASSDYNTFRYDCLNVSGKEYFAEDLKELSDKYDVVVAGSDQVWNVQMGDYNDAFFLGWSNAKKIAYAPSLGGRHLKSSNNYETIRMWLEDFSSISVREEVGKRCLEEVTGRNITKVLDPTLIIDEKTWFDMADKPMINGDYIFYYSWAYCEDSTSKIVADIARKLDLPVYVIDARKWMKRNYKKWKFILFESTGPKTFLNLMKYAKYCYVESFHGMIFAYIFKKDFWLLDTHEKMTDLDTRLAELVSILGVQDRLITEYNVNDINQEQIVDYERINQLEKLRRVSWEYLDNAFNEVMK